MPKRTLKNPGTADHELGEVLDRRALGRALLERQMLLLRSKLPAFAAI